MAKVHITNVVVLDNPSPFLNPFQFELTFECIEELKEDLEWKMIYVGSAETEEHDQVLDTIYVGPIPEGRHMFVFQAPPPDVNRIPENDALGVTVVLLTCSYRSQEFVRVGYFINNEYSESEPELRENPPAKPQFDKVVRNILASEPRVTRFKINWAEPDALGSVPSHDAEVAHEALPSNDSCGASFNADSQISAMEFQGSFSGCGDNSNSILRMES
ncbi:Histone chaperone asf1 [Eumeta japonica]|uniref:Histone chaperone asf1 n=1 Tax=Eumeta variegata TaxID=151549 RepID=A0A4C2A2U2_EUMVA|nr:Histone chaperone asf1 [Eumeta japonica]